MDEWEISVTRCHCVAPDWGVIFDTRLESRPCDGWVWAFVGPHGSIFHEVCSECSSPDPLVHAITGYWAREFLAVFGLG